MRDAVTIIFLFLLLSIAGRAGAVEDSVSMSTDIVNSYYAEAASLVESIDKAGMSFRAVALEKREKALSDLRSISISKRPSRTRYDTVRELSEQYMDSVISDVERLKSGVGAGHGDRIDDISAQLTALKDFKLKALEETLKIEAYEKKRPKPVPLIDRERTPFENKPDEPPGIWFR